MSDIVTLAKELVAAEAVITGEAFAARDARIAELKAELVEAEAARAAERERFDAAINAAIAVGDAEAFERGLAAARAEAAAAAEAAVVQPELPLEVSTEVVAVIDSPQPEVAVEYFGEAFTAEDEASDAEFVGL